jgi:hypothetical protein
VTRSNFLPPLPLDDGFRSAKLILDGVVHDLSDYVARHGVRTEETIRAAGFFESAKALWFATGAGTSSMPRSVLHNRLRILIDICPPELKSYGEKLELALKILEKSEQDRQQQRRA